MIDGDQELEGSSGDIRPNGPPSLRLAATFNRGRDRVRWIDFVWLVYSCFFFIEPIERNSRAGWINFTLFYLAFLAIYTIMVVARNRWLSRLSLGAMAVLGLCYIPRNPGTVGVLTFVAAFLPFVVERISIVVPLIIALCTAAILEGWLLHLSPWSWAICTLVSLAV